MGKAFFTLLFVFNSLLAWTQQFSLSVGVYTGLTSSYTSDKGINKDPRYQGRYEAKFAPIGVNIGVDYEGFGLIFAPGIINVGQNFYVTNTLGGQEGLRKIDLQYLNVPIALKVHLINLTFFKLSAVASIAPAILLQGKEEINHNDSKLQFPPEVYPILPPDYTVEYDGVLVPKIDQYSLSQKKDFKSFQLFAGAGFRADLDVSNHWRVAFDFRVNYGIFNPRTDEYSQRLKSNILLYELPGERRDMFAQVAIGISRYIEFEKSDKERKKQLKGTTKKYKPAKYPGTKPRTSKPKG
ncbi:MAG TPA: outer membrane beta-barrel protein [Chryseolinea sp.]|nr:outer membrane beta-barrel protein [Chryseolinea sp.]